MKLFQFSKVTDITSLAMENNLLQQLETLICTKFVPVVTGLGHFNDTICNLLSLTFRLGGLNLINPVLHLPLPYETS